jgi:hypothetical protein
MVTVGGCLSLIRAPITFFAWEELWAIKNPARLLARQIERWLDGSGGGDQRRLHKALEKQRAGMLSLTQGCRFGRFRHQYRVRTNHQVIARLSKRWERHER